MQLTSLETALITGFSAIIGAVVTHLTMSFRCVNKAQCERRHHEENNACAARHAEDCKSNEALRKNQQTQFRMIRALVVYSDIPKEEKERILNDREAA